MTPQCGKARKGNVRPPRCNSQIEACNTDASDVIVDEFGNSATLIPSPVQIMLLSAELSFAITPLISLHLSSYRFYDSADFLPLCFHVYLISFVHAIGQTLFETKRYKQKHEAYRRVQEKWGEEKIQIGGGTSERERESE